MPDTQIETLNDINLGDFIKLVDRDKQGKFSYVGEVIEIIKGKEKKLYNKKIMKGAKFKMLTFEGVMGFDMSDPDDDSNNLFKTTKPVGWKKFKENPKKFKESLKEKNEIKPTKTKREQVFDLVKNNSRKGEKSLLTMAKKEIGGGESQLKSYIKLALTKK